MGFVESMGKFVRVVGFVELAGLLAYIMKESMRSQGAIHGSKHDATIGSLLVLTDHVC